MTMDVRFADSVGYPAHVVSFGYGANRPRKNGLAYIPPDALHILACPAVPLKDVLDVVPEYFVSELQLKAPNTCCKQVENLEIEAWWTQQSVKDIEGRPDLYKFHCQECTSCHVRLMVVEHPEWMKGERFDPELLKFCRPVWEI